MNKVASGELDTSLFTDLFECVFQSGRARYMRSGCPKPSVGVEVRKSQSGANCGLPDTNKSERYLAQG